MVFKNAKTVITVWAIDYPNKNFVYSYAPIGYECTIVAMDVKDGKLHTSITPATIAANQSINLDLKENTSENFKAALKALN